LSLSSFGLFTYLEGAWQAILLFISQGTIVPKFRSRNGTFLLYYIPITYIQLQEQTLWVNVHWDFTTD